MKKLILLLFVSCSPLPRQTQQFQVGQIVTHKTIPGQMLVIAYTPPEPAYKLRLTNGNAIWFYTYELRGDY